MSTHYQEQALGLLVLRERRGATLLSTTMRAQGRAATATMGRTGWHSGPLATAKRA